MPIELRHVEGVARLVVPVRVDGRPATWMIDTGASEHASWVAADRDREHDHHGAAAFRRADGSIDLLPQESVSLELFPGQAPVARPLPVSREAGPVEAGLSGRLSPQRVLRSNALVIDLAGGALYEVPATEVAAWRERFVRLGVPLVAHPTGDGSFVPLVVAHIEGRSVSLVVDVGAPLTAVYVDTEEGAAIERSASHHVLTALVDREVDVAVVPAAVNVAGVTTTTRVLGIPRERPDERHELTPRGIDGLLGLDVLRGCAVLLVEDGGALACEPTVPLDTAPLLETLPPLPSPTPLSAEPRMIDANGPTALGCVALDAAALGGARDVQLRRHAVAAVAERTRIRVDAAEVDQAFATLRAQHQLDEVQFEAAVVAQQGSIEAFRAELHAGLLELRVLRSLGVGSDMDDMDDMDTAMTEIVHRWTRVDVERDRNACVERWPVYYPSQVDYEGLSHDQENAVRAAVARLVGLDGLGLGLTGRVSSRLAETILDALENSALEGSALEVSVVEEGARLRLRVAPRRSASDPR